MTSLLFTKAISLFLLPLGAAILVGGISLGLSFTSWRRLSQALIGCVLLTLWILGTPIFAAWVNVQVTSLMPSAQSEKKIGIDAIILLGGTPCTRIVHALRLYNSGEAPRILITGGNLPWQDRNISEAERVANELVELGAPRAALVLETRSRTTRENAVYTAAIFMKENWSSGLLVTSSTHMPRALAAFKRVGVHAIPAIAGSVAGPLRFSSPLDYLPQAEALAHSAAAIKEILGLTVYRLRGWV